MRRRSNAGDPIPSIRSQFTGAHHANPDSPPQARVDPGRSTRPARSHVIGLGLIGLAAGVAWLLGLGHAAWLWPGQSDSASIILLGQDMINGNWALDGWLLPTDTYWLTEVPLYAVAVSIRGVVPSLIHDVPLLLYLGVIVSGILVARAGRPGIRGWAGAALTFILLGMLGPSAAVTVLHGPAHISTALACLLAFAALRWASARRPAGYLLGFVLLAIALVSDPMARAIGLAPILAAAAIVALRTRAWSRPAAQAATALGALLASQAIRVGVQTLGGYTVGGGGPDLDGPDQWIGTLPQFVSSLVTIFSGQLGSSPSFSDLLAAAHLAVLFVVALCVAVALWHLLGRAHDREAWLDGVLALGAGATVGAFFLSGYVQDATAIRYLSPGFIFGAVLAGRLAPNLLASVPRLVLAPASLLLFSAYLITFTVVARSPIPSNPATPLAGWLVQRGLTNGYGAYWDAHIVTLMSSNRVRVLPVLNGPSGLEPSHWNSTLAWYRTLPDTPVTFVVFEPMAPWGGVDEKSAAATFGPPDRSETLGRYRILIWDHDLAPTLRPAER